MMKQEKKHSLIYNNTTIDEKLQELSEKKNI